MAIDINAKTTGVGGLETSADNSGNINIQSGGTTVMAVTSSGVDVTGDLSIGGSSLVANPSFRNILINGDMNIAQRGTSKTGLSSGGGVYTVDRWYASFGSLGTWTQTQDSSVPSGQGFAKSLKFACTAADASPATGDYFILHYRIEGQMLQHLKKGTSNAEKVTLSFWIKSNKTGTYQVNLRDQDNTRIIGKTYTIDAADTWEKKTITYDGDTTGTLDNDNGNSLQLGWWFGSGSTFTSGSVPTSWEASDNADRNAGGTVNLADSTSNYINITGVQLEVGDTATEFEHLPYDVQLQRCQRYYYDIVGDYVNDPFGMAMANSSTQIQSVMSLPVAMRTTPTLSSSSTASLFRVRIAGTNKDGTALPVLLSGTTSVVYITQEMASGMTAGQAGVYRTSSGTETFLAFSAEL